MNIGKVSENVLNRSILKNITVRRSEIPAGMKVGEDCAVLSLKEGEKTLVSAASYTEDGLRNVFGCIVRAANGIWAKGGTPYGILAQVTLPETAEEAGLKQLTKDINAAADKLGLGILGVNAGVSRKVSETVVTITALGGIKADTDFGPAGMKPGNEIVISKWVGLEGTALMAEKYRDELAKRYPQRMIYEAESFGELISVQAEAAPAVKSGVTAMYSAGEGGIFAALWEMAEAAGVGLNIDLRAIPIKQETIEICNFFDLNPYLLASAGALIMATDNAEGLVSELSKAGIEAVAAGMVTASNDRVLINGGIRRFLEPAKPDEIYKMTRE